MVTQSAENILLQCSFSAGKLQILMFMVVGWGDGTGLTGIGGLDEVQLFTSCCLSSGKLHPPCCSTFSALLKLKNTSGGLSDIGCARALEHVYSGPTPPPFLAHSSGVVPACLRVGWLWICPAWADTACCVLHRSTAW